MSDARDFGSFIGRQQDCPEGPHRLPQGPNEDIGQCRLCLGLSYALRPEGETYGEHAIDCFPAASPRGLLRWWRCRSSTVAACPRLLPARRSPLTDCWGCVVSGVPDSSLRERVTALQTLAAKETPGAWESACNALPEVLGWLLEALDTIDKARELHIEDFESGVGPGAHCPTCEVPWPCPTWQALNGGTDD